MEDTLPHVLTQQALSTPVDVYGPPGFVSRAILKEFVNFWPADSLADKQKHQFQAEKFVDSPKMGLKDFLNFKIPKEILVSKDLIVKNMKQNKPKEYAVTDKAVNCMQIIMAIG